MLFPGRQRLRERSQVAKIEQEYDNFPYRKEQVKTIKTRAIACTAELSNQVGNSNTGYYDVKNTFPEG